MREELVKFARHQKQFRFLYDNDIETMERPKTFKENTENKIDELIMQRKQPYGKDNTKDEIAEINKELRALRKDMRMCDRIMIDVEVVKENYNQVDLLEQQSKSFHNKFERTQKTLIYKYRS